MKKLICLLLALMLVFCGCDQSAAAEDATDPAADPTQNVEAVEVDPPKVTLDKGENETGAPQVERAVGAQRIEYTQNMGYVRYITRAEDLPDCEALDGYRNEEYFASKALLVVVDTVSSGSVQVSIGSVGDGTVTLAREMSGDAGTTDMATWLLWAEVEQGLSSSWTVTNPGVQGNLSKY